MSGHAANQFHLESQTRHLQGSRMLQSANRRL